MSLYEYDEEKVRRWQQEEARELRIEEGMKEGQVPGAPDADRGL